MGNSDSIDVNNIYNWYNIGSSPAAQAMFNQTVPDFQSMCANNTPIWNNSMSYSQGMSNWDMFMPSFNDTTDTYTQSDSAPSAEQDLNTPVTPYSYEGWNELSTEEKINAKYNVSMKASEKEACITQLQQDAENERNAEYRLGASLGFASLFAVPTIYKGAKGHFYGSNQDVRELFFAVDKNTGKAKYDELFKKHSNLMHDAQEELKNANRSYKGAMRKHNSSATKKDYKKLVKMMKDALDTKDPQKIAEATARLKAANGVKYSKLQAKGFSTKWQVASSADVSKVVAKKPFLKRLGGKGILLGLIMSGLTLYMSKDDIKDAYKMDNETGKKQLRYSITEAIAPIASYTIFEAVGKKATTKLLTWGARKLIRFGIRRGVGAAIGATIGSIAPGVGTVIGLAIGTAVDWAVQKYLIPYIFKTKNTPVEDQRIACMSKEDLFKTIVTKQMNGQELTDKEKQILNKNQESYYAMAAEIQAQQAQQGQQMQPMVA